MPKHSVGEHRSWDEHFWAYGTDAKGNCVLVRCKTVQDAEHEKDMMKMSNARQVGYTRTKRSELEVRKDLRERGWKITLIRDYTGQGFNF